MSLTKWDEAPTRVPGPLTLSSSSDVPNGSLYIGSDGDMIFKNTLGQPLIHGYKLMIYQPRNATDIAGPGTFTSTTETAFISTLTTTNIRNGLGMNIKAGMLSQARHYLLASLAWNQSRRRQLDQLLPSQAVQDGCWRSWHGRHGFFKIPVQPRRFGTYRESLC